MHNQRNHNFLLNEIVLLEVLAQAQDVINHIEYIVIIDLRRQIFEDNVQQIIEFSFNVTVALKEIGHLIGRISFTGHQSTDMGKDIMLLVTEVGLDIMLVLLEETDEHLTDASAQLLGDSIKMALDVRQALLHIVLVRFPRIVAVEGT